MTEASNGNEADQQAARSALAEKVRALGLRAKRAAPVLAQASAEQKNHALEAAAVTLEERQDALLEANRQDVEAAKQAGISAALLDRLRLTESRLVGMSDALRELVGLPDPVGQVVESVQRPNGLSLELVRTPLGVVGIVYESRPNVTSDAAGLCLKSGNAAFLRGSSSAIVSNAAIVAALHDAYESAGIPRDALVFLDDPSREAGREMMRLDDCIDCLIPRGGPSLIAAIRENATVPYILDGDGNCHVYIDASADLAMAEAILVNGKTQRPSVCNATESLVVHSAVAEDFLPRAMRAMPAVEFVGDGRARLLAQAAGLGCMGVAEEKDYATEYLDYKLSVRVVDSLEDAITHVNRYGTGHSEVIVTSDNEAGERFCREVDAACVLHNASSRFVDGGEMGYGSEIGISTQKLHVRGPMGLIHLTALKNIIRGNGQVRG